MNYLLYCVYKIILIIQDDEKKNTESKEKLRKKKIPNEMKKNYTLL